MNTLLNAMSRTQATKFTENGAVALNSTLDATLDLFGVIGAMRWRTDEDIASMFAAAYGENPLLAMKMLFYCRDCRGGQGEKNTFKVIARYMAENHSDAIKRNMKLIPFFGRWDDLYIFEGTPLESYAFNIMLNQLKQDMVSDTPSLLAKWLKSENTTSKESRRLATKTRMKLHMGPREYRKTLSNLRKKIDLVEAKMSANEWTDINYAAVPSIAHKNYQFAFSRHDDEGYRKYLDSLESGEVKINASTLFPYDLVRKYIIYGDYVVADDINRTVEAQWKALPKYLNDKNFLVMADTSGSMAGLPMYTSTGLAIKFAEENEGAFGGHFITFTDHPRLVNIPKNLTLREKLKIVLDRRYVGYDTNLEAAFELVLDAAIKDNIPQKDMPEAILIISDMEINDFGSRDANTTFTEEMKERFAEAGYKMPTLVYWNVNARANTFHATASDDVRFVSGSSASIFKDLCENMGSSAKDLMLNTLMGERYQEVQ